jgi:AcrR family transcriptional regulator
MKKGRPRRRKTREENMEIIKRVTMDFLQDRSYMEISVNKIAEASGINISQIYRYFPNGKPDILIAIGNDTAQEGTPDPNLLERQDPRAYLSTLISFYVETHRKNSAVLSSLQAVFLSYPETVRKDAEVIDTGGSAFSAIETLVERVGLRDAPQKKAVARCIFHLLDTMIHRQILETKVTPSDEELVDFLADVVLAYLERLKERAGAH